MKQNGRYMDMIYPNEKMRKVPVEVEENINVNVVTEVIAKENVLPKVEAQPEIEIKTQPEPVATPQTENPEFDFDKELEKAFEGVDFSDETFRTNNKISEDNIAEIEDVAAQIFVDESVPSLNENKTPEPDEAPDANNYSLGNTENPFLPGARVDKRPLGLNVKPNAESANITKSTKNVYARREMLNRPVPMSSEPPTMIVDNPKKKDHGFLWALLIMLVTLLGAGVGALVYYLVYNK
ncbi:MAG: hypothetical protein LBE03_01335 [Candidatus Nomurabacteria bacterium]|jgi:hypothetical protein|nr:hypothetical protein [Candidatus Nomurabacteria bacterium]